MKHRVVRLAAAAAVAAVVAVGLSACGAGSESGGGGGEPRTGGSLTVISQADSSTMDPLITYVHSTVDALRAQAIFDLLAYTDVEGNVVPRIAESITANEDSTIWTVKIRPDVEFSDGTPYDAAAVKFNIDRDGEEENRSTQYLVAKDLVTTVVDPLTLDIQLPEPNTQFDRVIAQSFALVPSPTAVEKAGKDFGQNPVGAGPFLLEDWVAGSHMNFARNPNYWQKGLPKLDKLSVKVVSDVTQQLNALASGEAQVVLAQQTDTVVRGEKAGHEVVATEVGGGATIYLNNETAPFDDLRARQALRAAIDMEKLTATVYGSTTDPATALFPADSPFRDDALTFPSPDAAKAQSIFDELAAEGTPLKFSFLVTSNPRNAKLSQYLQGTLGEFDNVEMEIESIADAEWAVKYRSGEFEATFGSGWYVNPYPVLNSVLGTGGPLNYPGYSNPKMDEALADTVTAGSAEELQAAYGAVQEIYLQDVPYLYTASTRMGVLHASDVSGVELFQLGSSFLTDQVGFTK